MIITLPLSLMNKNINQNPAQIRKSFHLKLKDVAYILGMNNGNLSSFETGKLPSPKALLGYHTLFNLSIQSSIKQAIHCGLSDLLTKCLTLSKSIDLEAQTPKNKMRKIGLGKIVNRLMEMQGDHE